MRVPTIIRRILKPLLGSMIDRIEDGRLIVTPSIWVPNFIFQRLIGVNRSCPWSVHYTSRVMYPEKITLGRRVAFSFAGSGGCYIQANNGIVFGDDVIFGPGVKIISANHDYEDLNNFIPARPIDIGKGCWIGANAVLLPGVTLGERVIVGAGAVVTKSFPGHTVVVGSPARIARYSGRSQSHSEPLDNLNQSTVPTFSRF